MREKLVDACRTFVKILSEENTTKRDMEEFARFTDILLSEDENILLLAKLFEDAKGMLEDLISDDEGGDA